MEVQQISVKTIICHNHKILLLQDLKGKWELPGGRIDFGESPIDALKRELNEELGCKNVKVGEFVDLWSFFADVEKESEKNKSSSLFLNVLRRK